MSEDTIPAVVKEPSRFMELVRNPAARVYVLIAGTGLIATCAMMFLFLNAPFAAAVLFLIGLGGIALNWTSSPALFILSVVYLSFFPNIVPTGSSFTRRNEVPTSFFKVQDFLFLGSVLVHLIGVYRLQSITKQGMPFEAVKQFIKPKAKPTVRPASPVPDSEIWALFLRVLLFLVFGQLVWYLVANVQLNFMEDWPITPVDESNEFGSRRYTPGTAPDGWNRFAMTAFGLGVFGFVVSFAFYYFWLSRMNRDEARMVILDTAWRTARRDYNRPEAWRGWMNKKLTGTLPRKGCGAWFLVLGVPIILALIAFFIIARLAEAGNSE